MRVLIATDRIGALTSAQAGTVLASGWSDRHATLVRPAAEAGTGFGGAIADTLGAVVMADRAGDRLLSLVLAGGLAVVEVPGDAADDGPIPARATSYALGQGLAAALDSGAERVLLDLVSDDVHDGGAGLLGALGARADRPLTGGVAELSGLSGIDLGPVRRRLAGVEVVGVVPTAQRERLLTGLRGITSVRGREHGTDPAELLAYDAALQQLVDLAAPGDGLGTRPGGGACGGAAAAVLALGGRLTTGPQVTLDGVTGPVDLVVTGCRVFDFARRGGGVVAAAARLAERLLCPCVVVAGEVLVGSREMRTLGIEAAYAVLTSTADAPTGDVTAEELARTASRVARNWQW